MQQIVPLLLTLLIPFRTPAQLQKIYLDPKAAINTSFSQLFHEVTFIPLETTKQSTFSRASQMVVTDEHFIILDQSLASIFFFDNKGSFLSVFKPRGENILDMQFVRSENIVFIRTQKRGLTFTEKQKFSIIETKTNDYFKIWRCDLNIPENFQFKPIEGFPFAGYTLYPLAGSRFLASAIFAQKDLSNRNAWELEYISGDHIAGHFFPYDQRYTSAYYNRINQISVFNSSGNLPAFFTRPYRYDIYTFTNGIVDTGYRLIFPASQSLPSDFFERNLSSETRWEVLRKEYQGAVQNIIPVLSWNNHLVFWLTTLQPNNLRDFKQYILDVKSQTLINARTLAADSLTFHLPVNLTWLMAADDTSVYTLMYADELSESASDKVENLPLSLQAFLGKRTPNSNPIIVRLINR